MAIHRELRWLEEILAERERQVAAGTWPPRRQSEVHKPFDDDGVTYCGWATGTTVIDGCGEGWPCSTVRAGLVPRDGEFFVEAKP